jgi:hypothetical protein
MTPEETQLWMFHFGCFLCESRPARVPLCEYLKRWTSCTQGQILALLGLVGGCITELHAGKPRWVTQNFAKASARVLRNIGE